jgi:AAA domain
MGEARRVKFRLVNGKLKRDNDDAADPAPTPKVKILTSKEYIATFRPPDWVVDGVFQRNFLYALTGTTGHGKTAVAMRLALEVQEGGSWGGVTCEAGDVVYFVGENPNEALWRWIAMGGDKARRAYFIVGTRVSLRDDIKLIKSEIERLGIKPCLIIIDTKAAFFEDDDENKNVEAAQQASDLRDLTGLPGNPAVLVLCHPKKYTSNAEQLTPRGGGAFLAAIDGNLTCIIDDDRVVTIHHGKKLRGSFDPLKFTVDDIELPDGYADTKGRPIKTVVAMSTTDEEIAIREKKQSTRMFKVLGVMVKNPGISIADIAKKLSWFTSSGELNRNLVTNEITRRLLKKNYVQQDNDTKSYSATSLGEKAFYEYDE